MPNNFTIEGLKKEFKEWLEIKSGKYYISDIEDFFLSKFSEYQQEVRKEIEKSELTWQSRSENRDNSYDDAFEDGSEVTVKKILSSPLLTIEMK